MLRPTQDNGTPVGNQRPVTLDEYRGMCRQLEGIREDEAAARSALSLLASAHPTLTCSDEQFIALVRSQAAEVRRHAEFGDALLHDIKAIRRANGWHVIPAA